MAKSRTMIKADICTSDAFLDMSHSAQALYFQLNVNADAQGVVSNPTRLLRGSGFDAAHLLELEQNGFVTALETAHAKLVIILHWWEMNKKDAINWVGSSYQNVLSEHICTLEKGRTYILKSDLPEGYELTGHEGELRTIEQAKRSPDCAQTETRLESVLRGKEEGKKREQTKGEKSLKEPKEKEERKAATVSQCPKCRRDASVIHEADGSTLFDCPSCGLFTIDANGEVV